MLTYKTLLNFTFKDSFVVLNTRASSDLTFFIPLNYRLKFKVAE